MFFEALAGNPTVINLVTAGLAGRRRIRDRLTP